MRSHLRLAIQAGEDGNNKARGRADVPLTEDDA